MPLMVYLYIYNKRDDDTSKEIQEDACKAASCKLQKQHKISSQEVGSWDPAAKVHMMTHEKQLRDFKTMYDEEQFFSLGRGDEDLDPHENSYESSLHFLTSNKQRAA